MKSYACASACVKAAMQIVWLADEMDKRGLLVGAYWFTVYIIFFAIMSLCMFILGNPKDPTTIGAMKAALKGREILVGLALESASAARCVVSLGVRRFYLFVNRKVANSSGQDIFDRISPRSSNTSTDLLTVPALTMPIGGSCLDSGFQMDGSVASAASTAGSRKGLSMDQAPNPYNAGFALPSFSNISFNQHNTFSQPLAVEMRYPLAAYSEGLQEESHLFPVFAPAWLDQASALQTPLAESEFKFY